jgi:hypothetical protein
LKPNLVKKEDTSLARKGDTAINQVLNSLQDSSSLHRLATSRSPRLDISSRLRREDKNSPGYRTEVPRRGPKS